METYFKKEVNIYFNERNISSYFQVEDEETPKFLDYIKLNADSHPIIFIKSAEKLKYLYNGAASDITATKIVEFLKSV